MFKWCWWFADGAPNGFRSRGSQLRLETTLTPKGQQFNNTRNFYLRKVTGTVFIRRD